MPEFTLSLVKTAALLLASIALTAAAQQAPSLDSPLVFTLQSHPDLRLESSGSGSPLAAWSGVINRSSLSPAQANSFRKTIPYLDYPGPGYRILSEQPE